MIIPVIIPFQNQKVLPLNKYRRNLQVFKNVVMGILFGFMVNVFFPQIVDLYKSVEVEALSSIYQYPLIISILVSAIPFLIALYFLNNNYHFVKLPDSEADEKKVYWFSIIYGIVAIILICILTYLPIYQLPSYL